MNNTKQYLVLHCTIINRQWFFKTRANKRKVCASVLLTYDIILQHITRRSCGGGNNLREYRIVKQMTPMEIWMSAEGGWAMASRHFVITKRRYKVHLCAILQVDVILLYNAKSPLLYLRGYKWSINGSRDGFVGTKVTRASRLN